LAELNLVGRRTHGEDTARKSLSILAIYLYWSLVKNSFYGMIASFVSNESVHLVLVNLLSPGVVDASKTGLSATAGGGGRRVT